MTTRHTNIVLCSTDWCSNRATVRGLCRSCYGRATYKGVIRRTSFRNQGHTCWWEGCDREATARGLCGKHYQKVRRSGRVSLPVLLGVVAAGLFPFLAFSTVSVTKVPDTPPVTTTTTAPCTEDMPCWNCHTMGNHVCGTVLVRL